MILTKNSCQGLYSEQRWPGSGALKPTAHWSKTHAILFTHFCIILEKEQSNVTSVLIHRSCE